MADIGAMVKEVTIPFRRFEASSSHAGRDLGLQDSAVSIVGSRTR